MLKKYISKFTIDVLPSVFATVVGAYIVNYYVVPKAKGDRPAAVMGTSDTKTPDGQAADAKPSDVKPADIKPTDAASTDTPAPETIRKIAIDRTDKAEPAKAESKAAESRRHPAREKAVAKVEPKPESKSEPVAPMPTPVVATVGTASSPIDERRDANDLARAAIERLSRESKDAKAQDAKALESKPFESKTFESKAFEPKPADAARIPERTASAQPQPAPLPLPVQQAQPMQQLPPPIVVANPNIDNPAPRVARGPRPPGDIPVPTAVDLEADADRGGRTNVAEDVLSAAKSVFNKVIPKQFER